MMSPILAHDSNQQKSQASTSSNNLVATQQLNRTGGNQSQTDDVVVIGELPPSVPSEAPAQATSSSAPSLVSASDVERPLFDDELPIELHPKQFFESQNPNLSFLSSTKTQTTTGSPSIDNSLSSSSSSTMMQPLQIQTDFQKFTSNIGNELLILFKF